MKLIRVPYGKENTPMELREYQIEGQGPVGTLKEFKQLFPDTQFEVIEKEMK